MNSGRTVKTMQRNEAAGKTKPKGQQKPQHDHQLINEQREQRQLFQQTFAHDAPLLPRLLAWLRRGGSFNFRGSTQKGHETHKGQNINLFQIRLI